VTPEDLARIDSVAIQLHEKGRRASEQHSWSVGTTYREAANFVRAEFDLPLLDYNGREVPKRPRLSPEERGWRT
jgi:hypothetical protein